MICPKCMVSIELVNKKDAETGMYRNYWFCEDCKEEVFPLGKPYSRMSEPEQEVLRAFEHTVEKVEKKLKEYTSK